MARYLGLCLMMSALATVSFWTKGVAAKVCYPDVGCFDMYFPCHLIWLPQSPSEINTKFFLYTPENTSTPEIIDYKDNASIVNSNFQASRETKFIIHGFNKNFMFGRFQDMKNALLSVGHFNVILVNWEDGANLFDPVKVAKDVINLPFGYELARQNTRLVGRQIGELSRKLQQLTGASYASMHLIGHSLGAHTAGYAGEYLSGQYGRITGLDPAGPGYTLFKDWPRCLLEKSDAIFVDIIHTDILLGNGLSVGHQNFYPNGGKFQPSCLFSFESACAHRRAIDFFTESITCECSWRAYPCSFWIFFKLGFCRKCGKKGCSRMGYYADLSPATGDFMLGTNNKKPYCKKNSGQPKRFLFF